MERVVDVDLASVGCHASLEERYDLSRHVLRVSIFQIDDRCVCREPTKVVGCPSQEGGFDDSVIRDEVDSVCVGYVKAGSRSYHVEARRPAKGAAVAASICCKPSIERTRAHARTSRRNATPNISKHKHEAMGCGVNNVRRRSSGYTRSTAMCNGLHIRAPKKKACVTQNTSCPIA